MERHLRDAQGQLQEKEVELLNCKKILMRDVENDLKDAQGQLQEKEELEENSNRKLHEMERHLRDAQGQLQGQLGLIQFALQTIKSNVLTKD